VLAQSVKISSKKITYTRPKAKSEFKKTFTVNYPKVKGISPSLAKKIEDSISYKKVLSFDLDDEINESDWLEEANFEVSYNQNYILCVYLSMEGSAAHPNYFGKSATVDLTTGKRIFVNDVFINQDKLVKKIIELQQDEIKDSIADIKSQPDYSNENTDELFKYAKFEKIHLEDFTIREDGVIFHYDYGFPYILRAIEPTGTYQLSWKELKPYIKKGSKFAQFVK
jgi:hypothetical protein